MKSWAHHRYDQQFWVWSLTTDGFFRIIFYRPILEKLWNDLFNDYRCRKLCKNLAFNNLAVESFDGLDFFLIIVFLVVLEVLRLRY